MSASLAFCLRSCVNYGLKNLNSRIKSCDALNSRLAHRTYANLNPSPKSEHSSAPNKNEDTFGDLKNPLEKESRFSENKHKNPKVIKVKKRRTKSKEADVFGNLSDDNPIWYEEVKEKPAVDNDQSDDSTLVKNISKYYRDPRVYLRKMKELVAEKKIKEALSLFIDMRRNYVPTLHAHYTFMIGACGRVGYTDMAFKLLRQMTDRGLKPSSATLTGLFNACGESPFPENALKRTYALKEKIRAKNWSMNQITYHALIKAFGKCGDIQAAFQVLDEMAKNDIKIDVVSYGFLLMSCISNTETGFTHAVEVWRKMKQRKCKPNLFSYNLLLRAVRDCDIGPEDVSCLLLQHWSSYFKRPYGFITKESVNEPKTEILQLQGADVKIITDDEALSNKDTKLIDQVEVVCDENQPSSLQERAMNDSIMPRTGSAVTSILNTRPLQSDVIELSNIKTASDRLSILGGAEMFLLDMKKAGVRPDIKTFTLLLESMPSTLDAEELLLSLLETYDVKPDMGFFNILIKKRSFRFDYAEAHNALALVNKWSLSPDIITFGVLALSCRTFKQAIMFLGDMKKMEICPSAEIIGSLLGNACTAVDFKYLESMLKLLDSHDIEPNERMIRRIEKTIVDVRKNIIDMENNKEVSPIYKRPGLPQAFKEFCVTYEEWLKNTKLEKEEHVWEQYKTDLFETNFKETGFEKSE